MCDSSVLEDSLVKDCALNLPDMLVNCLGKTFEEIQITNVL